MNTPEKAYKEMLNEAKKASDYSIPDIVKSLPKNLKKQQDVYDGAIKEMDKTMRGYARQLVSDDQDFGMDLIDAYEKEYKVTLK
jgi:hypothetical protein